MSMNIFVLVKQVPDTETKIRPDAAGKYIETESIKWVISPYDEFAIEQALLVKGSAADITTTAIRVGEVHDAEALRTAMAMGIDESILVQSKDLLDPYSTAMAIKYAIEKSGKKPDLIFAGKQAIDTDGMQVPQILSEILDLPCVSVIVDYKAQDANRIVVKREIEGGNLEVYQLATPAIITCNKALNTPRYAPLPGIMKAKKKPLMMLNVEDAGVKLENQKITYTNFRLPAEKAPGKKITAMEDGAISAAVKEVLGLLRTQSKVL